jgi:NADH-quinone oxidoreductase subunit L
LSQALAAGLVLLLPLAGFAALTSAWRALGRMAVSLIACGVVVAAFVFAVFLAVGVSGSPAGEVTFFPWFGFGDPATGGAALGISVQLDALSAFMCLVVTGVGSLIIIYSTGYMWDDPGFLRFFAYMDLFIFSMLMLVLAGNFALLIVGWGLVGLASYLLIGFWYERRSAVLAARKAFVMNVIGDVAMVLAAGVIYWNLHSLDYGTVFTRAASLPFNGGVILAITLLLLVGAVAKSAQLPLHTWLPDAMEGPTPVSALIHAATMVTAGVYLVARMHPLYLHAPAASNVVAIIGAVTAIFAATIALAQTDIKRVLAYSTMSQIGYMFLAVGVGSYAAGLFHLMTHAFFKALLFLAAGNVIHAMADEQDIRLMGGLKRALPWSRLAFGAGALAISGVPLFSGFFSKEAILGAAFANGPAPPVLWIVGVVTAVLTGFYMFRLYILTFEGQARWPRGLHPHEAPAVMLLPVLLLALLSVFGGYIQTGAFGGGLRALDTFLSPAGLVRTLAEGPPWAIAVGSVAGLAGLAGALFVYSWRWIDAGQIRASVPGLARMLERKYYFDEIYDAAFVRVNDGIARMTDRGLDQLTVGGAVSAVRDSPLELGALLRPLQSGFVRSYAAMFLAGVAVVAGILVVPR